MNIVPENFSDECLGKFIKPSISLVPENFSPADQDRFLPDKPTSLSVISPRSEIDQGLSNPMTFAEAMEVVLRGGMIRRLKWPRPETIVKLVDKKLTIFFGDSIHQPLIVTTHDLQGRDWVRVLEK